MQNISSNQLQFLDIYLWLYNHDEESHCKLLQEFADLVKQYGIMLSHKKMVIAQREVEFLGMHSNDEAYHPSDQIARDIFKFSNENHSHK